MPNQTAFATPEIARRYRDFWQYGGRWFSLTDEEFDFVEHLVNHAPELKRSARLLDGGYRRLDVGALMKRSDGAGSVERIMIAALLAYGTLPNFVWAGCGERLLEFLPTVDSKNLKALSDALLKLARARETASNDQSAAR
jgi:hypothetical protein